MRRRALLSLLPLAALAASPALRPAAAQTTLERLGVTALSTDSFVQIVTINGNYEIESSRLLLARSQQSLIRAFAERMIEHHAMMASELRALPEAATRPPAGLDERHAAWLQTLRRQEEVDFLNRHYVEQQIEAHQQALAAFEAYATDGEAPALRAFARAHAPTIHRHLEMARALQAG
jgi:putative membrane protein